MILNYNHICNRYLHMEYSLQSPGKNYNDKKIAKRRHY
jgi:hypothetical protein